MQLLGGLRIARGNEVVTRFRTQTADLVFAYLAVHRGRQVSRDRLIELAWPESSEMQGRQSLRTALTSIRKLLGAASLGSNHTHVWLEPGAILTDYDAFLATNAIEAYGGRFVPHLHDAWSSAVGLDLEHRYVTAICLRMQELERGAALALGREALARDPSRLEIRELVYELAAEPVSETPYFTTSFVGRHRELAQIEEQLRLRRLVTLTGPAGCGKTRLANRLCTQRLPDSWFVRLADLRDPKQVAESVRSALDLPVSDRRSALEQVAHGIGESSGLLVLDNFEHLVEGATLTLDLLARCPNLSILVTSQIPLGLNQEVNFPLGPLGTWSDSDGLSESASLFTDRAKSYCPSFQLEPNRDSVERLCAQLEGYPLAIEIAAAKVRLMSPAEMCDELSDRFEFLATKTARPTHHASLRGALEWSFERLDLVEQDILADLTVFRDGFELPAARTVIGKGGVDSALDALIASSWVAYSSCNAPIRFRMLESIREFASELLTPKRRSELLRSHAINYYELARFRFDRCFCASEPEANAVMDREQANCDAAWDWLIQQDPNRALDFAVWMSWHWILRGQCQLCADRVEDALARCDASPGSLAHAYVALGNSAYYRGRPLQAFPSFTRALSVSVERGDDFNAGLAHIGRSEVLAEMGEYADALAEVDLAELRLAAHPNRNWYAPVFIVAAMASNRAGRADDAIRWSHKALEIFGGKDAYEWGLASALNELAMGLHLSGRYEESLEAQRRSIGLKRKTSAHTSLALSLADLSVTLSELAELDLAAEAVRESLEILERIQSLDSIPQLYAAIAKSTGDESIRKCAWRLFDALAASRPSHAHLRAFGRNKSSASHFESLDSDLQVILDDYGIV